MGQRKYNKLGSCKMKSSSRPMRREARVVQQGRWRHPAICCLDLHTRCLALEGQQHMEESKGCTKVVLIPDLAPQFGEQLENRNWGRLATYPAPASIAVVKEFYTNARRLGDHLAEDYLSYVKGHAIRYDPNSINKFLNTEWAEKQEWCLVNIRRVDLTPLAKYWMAFSHANIQLCSHVLDITVSRALLLYCVLRGMSINIGQVMANEIQVCANTMNSKEPLEHPSLIIHLCELARVNISAPPFERPRKAIDEAYYKQYCGGDEAAQPVPLRCPRRERGPPQGQASKETQEFNNARLQSIHRGQVAIGEMIIGMYDTPPAHRWTMDEFDNVVAWLEEQAQGSGAGASAMDDDDDEDAFEDA
ncbi:hypothetical protein LR48_Vigan06g094300 [Vigna angularis]|uniref:Putative plant transposon protein domain-containing protein n=1 Tax=Phaseolus angularis TaxID=3914 RepID=A0A0L9UST8_PHAAN|nr:hypothetical protein LR48_Vigan06g094300 [Vigna angularis]